MSFEPLHPAEPGATRTVPQFLRAIAAAYGDETALVFQAEQGGEVTLSFAELERRSALLARGLLARGVGKGTRVGFIHGNSPDFAVLLFAIARTGAIAIPISTLIKADELVRVLRQSDVAGLIVQRHLMGKDYVERLLHALPPLASVSGPELRLERAPYLRWIVADDERDLPASIRPQRWLDEAADSIDESLLAAVEAEVHPADQAIEIYTSGSMAMPKGVKHNHGPLVARTHYIRRMLPIERGGEDADESAAGAHSNRHPRARFGGGYCRPDAQGQARRLGSGGSRAQHGRLLGQPASNRFARLDCPRHRCYVAAEEALGSIVHGGIHLHDEGGDQGPSPGQEDHRRPLSLVLSGREDRGHRR